MADGDEGWDLVTPFVVCKPQGPYDADAFVAGHYCGSIGTMLRTSPPTAVLKWYVPTPLVPQLDLLAMRHRYRMTAEPWDEHPDEWTFVTFKKGRA